MDPKARLSIDDVLNHRFFSEMNTTSLYKKRSSHLESLGASQETTLTFRESLTPEFEKSTKQMEKKKERHFNLPVSHTRHSSISTGTASYIGKPPANPFCLVPSRTNSEDKENL